MGQGVRPQGARAGARQPGSVLHRFRAARRGDREAGRRGSRDNARPGDEDGGDRPDPVGLRTRPRPQSHRDLRPRRAVTKPCIITVAITGSVPGKKDNPAVPIAASEQIESTHEAFEAGAALVHLHVRNDDGTPSSAPERFAKVLEGIRKRCPGIITQLSTGGRSGAGRERGGMLALKPDMASLATGSVNFPARVYENSPELVDWLAAEMLRFGIKPEVEAFDLSMIFQAASMQKAGKIKGPLHVQFVMGVKNAMPVDRATFEFYAQTLKRLAPDATWTGAGIGRGQVTLVRSALGPRGPRPPGPRAHARPG